jgi:hypothetical protein
MTKLLNELATIEFSDDILSRLDLSSIYESFRKNYRKLDDLKHARSEYEERNALMRWWHNDKLQDAQLDSAEVQAEFSKTIGQLMLISIMQSKKLVEQQTQLTAQQGKLQTQAEGIAQQASQLQLQHHRLADQSTQLEKLVHEYFELKGLTEEGAERLIAIAAEVKGTKDDVLQQFANRMRQIDDVQADVTGQMASLSRQVDAELHRHLEHAQDTIGELEREMRERLVASESHLREKQHVALQEITAHVTSLERSQKSLEASVLAKSTMFDHTLSAMVTKIEQRDEIAREQFGVVRDELCELATSTANAATAQAHTSAELASCHQQQRLMQELLDNYHNEVSARFKRLYYVYAGLGLGVASSLAGVIHLLK